MHRSLVLLFIGSTRLLSAPAEEKVDLNAVHRIRTEALDHSRVMDHLFFLTDVHGPRLTGSTGYRDAAEWAVKKMQEYGAVNAHLEKWGPFGRSWEYKRFSAHIVEPTYFPLIGFPMAFTEGTKGMLKGDVVFAPLRTADDFPKHKGKLRGKIALISEVRATPLQLAPQAIRHQNSDLAGLYAAPDPNPPPEPGPFPTEAAARRFRTQRAQFLRDEGVLAAISSGTAGDGGTVFATSGGSQRAKEGFGPPGAAITPEHYNRIVRLLEHKMPVKLEMEVQVESSAEERDSFNVVAELPGSTGNAELVIIGAHLDSWHGGTGATDNAAGSAVMMEVMRVLKAIGTPLKRTVRLVLWSGEEQGLLGSKAYVKEHFADPATMKLYPGHGRVAAYFNMDNGTGKIRGVYLQGNDMVRPIFERWLEPLRDLGVTTLAIRNTGGTDHLSFDAVGIPGFQFIQDPIEYNTRTHHSNMDVYDHTSKADLMQASAVIASFVYHAAMREEMLPRKPLPKPVKEEGQTAPPLQETR